MGTERVVFTVGALGAALLALLGSLLPWAQVDTVLGSLSRAGTDGDGVITLVLAVCAAFLVGAVLVEWHRWLPIIAAVIGGAIYAVAIVDLVDVQNRVSTANGIGGGLAHASVGMGLFVTLAGAVGVVACGVLLATDARFHVGRSV